MPDSPRERSSTYVEFVRDEVRIGHPNYKAWEDWLYGCGFPIQQVALNGWVARDEERKTVSALVHRWRPDEEPSTVDKAAPTIARRDASGTDCEYAVHTIQLDEVPPPFPEPHFSREDREYSARRSLTALWRIIAKVGDLTDEDTEPVRECQRDIDNLRRMLASIDRERDARGNAERALRLGVTYSRNVVEGVRESVRRNL